MAQCRPDAEQDYPRDCDPLYLMFMEEALSRPAAPPEPESTLTVFPDAGQVDVRQVHPTAGMRIYFLSGPYGSHNCYDKNSFILEAFGKVLLIDRGPGSYGGAGSKGCGSTSGHNTVAPNEMNQHPQPPEGHPDNIMDYPAATLLRAEEKDSCVLIASDAALAWPDIARKVLRRVIHIRPDVLVVEGRCEWNRPVTTRQYWNALASWRRDRDAWVLAVDGVELRVQPLLPTDSAETDQFGSNCQDLPVHRLVVSSPAGEAARFITVLQARPSAEAPWPCEFEYDSAAETLTLRRSDGRTRTLRWTADGVEVS